VSAEEPAEARAPSALASRDFRLYFVGQALSQLGTKMQGAALLWHLSTLTQSPIAMGGFGLVRVAPLFLLGLVGGLVADRVDRRRLLIKTELTLGVLAALLALWTFHGLDSIWPIYAVSLVSGIVSAFDGPARQSLLPNLVKPEQLSSAVALDSLAQKVAKVLGPLLMGLVLAGWGPGAVYLMNGGSYLAVLGSLVAMRVVFPPAPLVSKRGNFDQVREGLAHVVRSPVLGPLIAMDFAASFFGAADTMLPLFASQVLHLGSKGYGLLAAAAPFGALLGSLGSALGGPTKDPWRRGIQATVVYGAAVVGVGLSRSLPAAMVALAIAATADAVGTVMRNTLRHSTTPDALRGRVASLNSMLSKTGPRLGELEAGLLASLVGVAPSIALGGATCLASVAVLVPLMRRRMGAAPGMVGAEVIDRSNG
jgi:MFS family permease